MELTAEQQRELDEFYWETDISTHELQEHFGLSKAVHFFASPLPTTATCPNCGSQLVYRSRTARSLDEKACDNCGHKDSSIYLCHCEHCESIKAEERRRSEEACRLQEIEAFKTRQQETSSPEYVSWALSKLSRREKIFLKAFLEVVQESGYPTWQTICDRAKVVSHKSYTDKLTNLGLLHHYPDGGIVANPAISPAMVEVKNVRGISESLRFEVFQRDNHTCQYCGRKAPEVKLEVDHLLPVSKGGTDEFDNLVTSCRECNSGKLAKIIKAFTGGYTKEEWREHIRRKRAEALQERRAQLDGVMQYWAECRGTKRISAYDANFIYNFIERYDPAWIKAAIYISPQRSA